MPVPGTYNHPFGNGTYTVYNDGLGMSVVNNTNGGSACYRHPLRLYLGATTTIPFTTSWVFFDRCERPSERVYTPYALGECFLTEVAANELSRLHDLQHFEKSMLDDTLIARVNVDADNLTKKLAQAFSELPLPLQKYVVSAAHVAFAPL